MSFVDLFLVFIGVVLVPLLALIIVLFMLWPSSGFLDPPNGPCGLGPRAPRKELR